MLTTTLLLTLALGGGGPRAAAASGGRDDGGRFGIQLLEAPVNRANDPRARYEIVDHLRPGSTIRRRVRVTNTSAKPLHVDMGATAATIERHRFTAGAGSARNELTSWISFDRPAFDVPARGHAVVVTTIRVPGTASEGERYAIVWAQTGAPPSGTHNIGVAARVGIRVYLDVGVGGEPASDFQIEKLVPARAGDGRPEVLAEVGNTGGRALEMSGELTLSDGPGGLRAGPFPATLGTALAPGDRAPVRVVLDRELPDGPWDVRLELSSGMIRRTATATLTFPAAGGTTGRPVWLRPARVGVVATAVAVPALAAAGFLLVRRRRRARETGRA
ncbi:hypothetical protein ACQP1K_10620 [Sphaerimonospora sp. CA-214678]|uniref:hypothetical protein n=1 Tax=Sphaerimonospora sp. CA-214678 TaxID=3240029 RepID=UPI003D94D85E